MTFENEKWKKVKIKLLTPLRVGSGNLYENFTLAKAGSSWHRLSLRGFYKYSKEFIRQNKPLQIQEGTLDRMDSLYPVELTFNDTEVEHYKQIYEMLHHPSGGYYIPGSSIKGVFRLAFMKNLLTKSPTKKNDFISYRNNEINYLKKLINEGKKVRPEFERTNKLLNSWMRGNSGELYADIFRFFLVSDTNVKNDNTQIWKSRVLKLFQKSMQPKPNVIALECIPAQTEFEFYVKVKTSEFQRFIREQKVSYDQVLTNEFSFEKILEYLSSFYKKAISDELERFQKLPNEDKKKLRKIIELYSEVLKNIDNKKYYIRIADGGGLMFTTLFSIMNNDARIGIRNIIKNHGQDPAPLSRHYIFTGDGDNETYLQMGWCEIILE